MAVRVKIKISSKGKSVVSSALLNSGFESDEPEVAIPLQVAKKLGIWPPVGAEYAEYETAAGLTSLPRLEKIAKIKLLLDDRKTGEVVCNTVIDENIDEILIGDCAIDELGISVLSFRLGEWRIKEDSEGKRRKSVRAVRW
jgi:hypothetical protein